MIRVVSTAAVAAMLFAAACVPFADPNEVAEMAERAAATTSSLLVAVTEAAPSATAAPETTVSIPLEARLGRIAVGHCADFGADGTLTQQDCGEPHDGELFARITYVPMTDSYPGRQALTSFAEERCPAQLASYVGGTEGRSGLGFLYFWPSSVGWERGDRTVKCFAVDLAGVKLDRSIRKAGG